MRVLRTIATVFILIGLILLGYPVVAAVTHGFDPGLWPSVAMTPSQWFQSIVETYGLHNATAYVHMASMSSPTFAGGGLIEVLAIASLPVVAFVLLFTPTPGPRRDPQGIHGAARWAEPDERRKMKRGVELGLDPVSGRPVRVAVEGNILTVAPPRSGKTSGLIIANLAAIDRNSWCGPAVIIDPKGEVYRATAARRREMGRTVRCLDPMNLVGGSDHWNPLASLDPNNIIYLQRLARALLPAVVAEENAYFNNRAVDAVVAALLAANYDGGATPSAVSDLLSNPTDLAEALLQVGGPTSRRMQNLLNMDSKTRDPVLSTAQQTFQWCDDERLQNLTSHNTFSLSDLCKGDTDLFITLPTEDMETLAPFLRWLLTDLFATIRRNRAAERLIIAIDETRTLGRCRELVTAASELPGFGGSLWTFWQDRSQVISTFGEHDAATLLRTAEFVTLSDPAMVDPDERDFWSRALSDFTILEETHVKDQTSQGSRASSSQTPRAVRLMTAEELGRLPANDLIVFPKSSRYAKRPLRLRKTRYDDQRLAGLTAPVAPVGPTA